MAEGARVAGLAGALPEEFARDMGCVCSQRLNEEAVSVNSPLAVSNSKANGGLSPTERAPVEPEERQE
jgi:hypothetical protein